MTGSGGGRGGSAAHVARVLGLAGHLSIMEHAARAPLLCPGPVSDGQFYSPPESVAGQWPVARATAAAAHGTRFKALPLFFADSDEELVDKQDGEKGLMQRVT